MINANSLREKELEKKMKKECKPSMTPQKLELEMSASLLLSGKGARLNQ